MAKFSEYLKNLRQSGRLSFTINQASSDLGISKHNVLASIFRIKKSGEIISPAKGFYVIIPPEHQLQGCLPASQLVPILMQHLKINYYVGLLSCAMYHGATHQKPNSFQIISDKQIRKNLKFGQVSIDVIYKKSLANLPLKEIVVDSGYLKISSPELTMMDLLLYPNRSGGLNHIATVLSELIEAIDVKKLLDLANISKQKFWLQKLGYILEKIDVENLKHKQKIIITLQKYLFSGKKNIAKNYVALAPEILIKDYPRCKKWMVVENTSIESDL
jgi:predicted transcriptional regulator of viral defense system